MIAYRQPISRSRVSAVRGVNVDGVVRTLLTRGLIEEVGAERGERRDPLRHHRLLPGAARSRQSRRPAGPGPLPTRGRRARRARRTGPRMSPQRPAAAAAVPDVAVGGSGMRRGGPGGRGVASRGSAPSGVRRRPAAVARSAPAAPSGQHGTTKPSQPTRLPERREQPARRSTSTTPTACGCRSCSPPPASGQPPRLREPHRRRAGSRSTARSSPSSGVRIDPDRQVVHVDGTRVQLDESRVYLAFNKPLGVVSTMSDDLGRPSLGDYVARPQGAALPRRPARRRHRGPAAAHQRRRAGPPAAAPVVRRAQDLPGPDRRARCRATSARRCARASSSRTGRSRSTRSRSSTPRPARRWSRSCCTRAASTSSAACSRPSGHPVITLVRTEVGPIHLGDLALGQDARRSPGPRSGGSTSAAGL